MTRRNLYLVRGGLALGLAIVVGLNDGDLRAGARRAHVGWWHTGPSAYTSSPQATAQTGQTTQAPPAAGRSGANGGRGGRPDGGYGPGGPGGLGGPGGGGWEWWNDAAVRKELGLRDDQMHRIDHIYQSRAKDIQVFVDDFLKERTALDKMLQDRLVDDATVQLQIGKMNGPLGQIQGSRILMLYRISKVLDADQNAKLKAIEERSRAEHGRGGEPRRPSTVPHE